MLRLLSTLALVLLGVGFAFAQTGELSGKVTDENGEGVPFANVSVEKNGVLVTGASTDFDGFYTIKPLDPGKYDVTISALGFGTRVIQGVQINSDKITELSEKLTEESKLIDMVEVVAYKVPLIDKENNSTKTTITADEIKSLPTRNVQSIASTSAGVYQSDEGEGVSIKGARSNGTEYYIDGIRVRGSTNLPANAIEQLTVITGGVPAKYGDATGGIINITTRGPSKKLNGSVDLITSQYLDKFGYNLVNFSLTGPIYTKNKGTDSADAVIGFFIAGEYNRREDPDPSAVGVWTTKEDVLNFLQQNPLAPSPTSEAFISTTETVTFDDLENVAVKPNSVRNDYGLAGKVDFKLSDNISITVGGQANYSQYHGYVPRYALFNYENNPLQKDLTWRVYARYTQRFGNKYGTENEENKSAFQNAFYSIQFDYTKQYNTIEDETHGFNPFNYGYLGQYDILQQEIYGFGADTATGKQGWLLLGLQDTLVTFTPSDINPTTSNYVERYYELAGDNADLYYSSLDAIRLNNGLLNGDRTRQTHGIWFNVGRQYNGYGISADNDQFRLTFNGSVDILRPGASSRNKHSLEFGFEFEQRIDRNYNITPIGLWELMRLQANKQISQLDLSAPILLIDGVRYEWDESCQCNPGAPAFSVNDTILYNNLYQPGEQSEFDKNLRNALGLPVDGLERINIDALDPSTFSLDMFSADELLNNGNSYVFYYGYDYTGKKLNSQPSFNDFFTEQDEDGNFLRNIGAYRPIYTAAYIQDKFNFKDLLFNVGIRVDRYDANQKVLKDPFSLYKILTVDEAVNIAGNGISDNQIPGGVGGDYAVYVDDFNKAEPTIVGFRNGNTWYNAAGEELTDPRSIATSTSTGRATPYLDRNLVNDIKSPDFNPDNSFEDYTPQVTVMPRVAFSFNITDEASFFAHYDILAQRPQGRIVTTPDVWYFFEDNISSAINNPNLRPEKTIDYQVGFRQLVTKNSAITFSAFYRELRDMVQVQNIAYAYPRDYLTFGNIDFGTVKGFAISYDMRKTKTNNLSLKLNYTLQFADGTGSDDISQGNLVSAGQPNLRSIAPLSYDSRHQLNITADYSYGVGKDYNGPTIKGKQILSDFGVNLIIRARSGEPYTQQSNATPEALLSVPTRPILKGQLNGSRLPWNFKVDLKISKGFSFNTKKKESGAVGRPLYLNVNIWIQNLLDTRNIINVYPYTGNPDDDGYLTSAIGQQDIGNQINPQSYIDLYRAWINNPDNYSLPRFIRLGLSFTF